jgi:hypothetical protein
LDAARAELTVRVLRELIRSVVRQAGRWRVVVSIRKFDLRYDSQLRTLFRGKSPSEHVDPEFKGICHLNVPRLTSDELAQLEPQSPDLYALVKGATSELYELMSVPFNLRLVADLLDDGVSISDLSPLRTQLQLLDRYWQRRLIRQDGQRDAREAILRNACEGMVRHCRLRVDRASVAEPGVSTWITDLLSHHVLAEWQPSPASAPDSYILTFSHHVLFDYAVERLLLRGEPEVLVARLSEDPDLILVVRPSLAFHFEHLWDLDPRHEQFWDVVFRIVHDSHIPEIGKLIGPAVAAGRAMLLTDIEILYQSLESTQEVQRKAAEAAVRHVIGALLTDTGDNRPIAGQGAGPWCDLLEQVSRNLANSIVYTLRPLLFHICQSPELLTLEQRSNAGKASRRLLEWAWRQSPRDSRLVIHGLEFVCRTFESDGIESATLIRRALDPQHVAQFGFEELPWLAREDKRLVPLDPDLVREIYRVTFTHEETSMEATPLFESRILGMISHRKQDYAMALHELNWAFPDFLLSKPLYAARTLIDVMEAFVAQEHAGDDIIEGDFDFRGTHARIKSDFSCVWDAREGSSHSDAVQMLDAFERHLGTLVAEPQGCQVAQMIIDVMAKENRLASIWRRLLGLGARFPDTIGVELLPLASAEPILTFLDTSYLAGEYLKSVFPLTSTSERDKIERAIMSMPSLSQQSERGGRIRDQLLACLPASMLVAEDSRARIEHLRNNEELPLNLPPITFGGITRREYAEEDDFREHGISVDQGMAREIRKLEKAMREFVPQNPSQVPSAEEVLAVIPSVHALKVLLSHAEKEGVHPELCKSAWGHLLEACNRIIGSKSFSCRDQVHSGIDSIILEGSRHPEPVHDPKYDAQFDRTQSWGSPAPRIEAARGLMLLGSIPECMAEELRGQIEKLSRDEVPAVRFQISGSLNALYYSSPELMWEVLERVCREETSKGVLKFVIHGPLERLAGSHMVRVVDLARNIFARIMDGPGAEGVREGCVNLFGRLYIWLGEASCGDIIMNIASHPDKYSKEASCTVGILREPLRHYEEEDEGRESEAVRRRAWDLVARILRSSVEGLNRLHDAYSNVSFEVWSKEDKEELQSLFKIVDHLGDEVYFASGAYGEKNRDSEEEILSVRKRERFYQEAAHVLDDLAEVGIASLTHHLLETLESFIPFDPSGVFIRIGRTIRAGEKGGYQYESLASDLFVKLVERYLAEYRYLFRENEDCRQILREVLDIFVQAGWPSARRLIYHLDEIFR